jgi:hypothetical protein
VRIEDGLTLQVLEDLNCSEIGEALEELSGR